MGAKNYKAKAKSFGASGVWLMQEGSGTLVDASAGGGFPLTPAGAGITYQVAGPAPGSYGIELAGINSGFFYYDNSTHTTLPLGTYTNAVGTNHTAYTGVIWVRFDSITDNTVETLLRQNTTSNYTNFNLVKHSSNNEMRSDEYLPSGNALGVNLATAGVVAGEWCQIAMVKDVGKREIWVNKVKVASDTSPETYGNNGTMRYFNLGCSYNGSVTTGVDGAIAFASAYQTALTETQLNDLVDAGSTDDSNPLYCELLRRRRR